MRLVVEKFRGWRVVPATARMDVGAVREIPGATRTGSAKARELAQAQRKMQAVAADFGLRGLLNFDFMISGKV